MLYRWGNPQAYRAGSFADQQLFWQHNPYWIPEGLPGAGNILIFNNGDEYAGRYLAHSSIVEITPPASGYGYAMREGEGIRYGPARLSWTYTAANPTDFLSRRVSSAQRLPNGNTLVGSSVTGVIFEVTPDGATVWRYVNPVVTRGQYTRVTRFGYGSPGDSTRAHSGGISSIALIATQPTIRACITTP